MPAKLITTVNNIDNKIKNSVNRELVKEFYSYLKNIYTSESYQKGLLKVIIRYTEYLGPETPFIKFKIKNI